MCLSQLSVSDVHTAACRAKAHHAADRSAIALLLRVPPLHKMATAEQMQQPGGGLLPQLSLIKSRLWTIQFIVLGSLKFYAVKASFKHLLCLLADH